MNKDQAISCAKACLKSFKGFGLTSPYLSQKNDIWTWKAYGWVITMNFDESIIAVRDEWK